MERIVFDNRPFDDNGCNLDGAHPFDEKRLGFAASAQASSVKQARRVDILCTILSSIRMRGTGE